MRPLTLETLQQIVATQTAVVQFPGHNAGVTVRQLTAPEASRVQLLSTGGDESSPELNREVELMIASICITDANYDTNEGREALAKLPRAMIHLIASASAGLSGADGTVSKN